MMPSALGFIECHNESDREASYSPSILSVSSQSLSPFDRCIGDGRLSAKSDDAQWPRDLPMVRIRKVMAFDKDEFKLRKVFMLYYCAKAIFLQLKGRWLSSLVFLYILINESIKFIFQLRMLQILISQLSDKQRKEYREINIYSLWNFPTFFDHQCNMATPNMMIAVSISQRWPPTTTTTPRYMSTRIRHHSSPMSARQIHLRRSVIIAAVPAATTIIIHFPIVQLLLWILHFHRPRSIKWIVVFFRGILMSLLPMKWAPHR